MWEDFVLICEPFSLRMCSTIKGCHFTCFILYLHELENSGVGCYMGGVFAGTTCYADDLKLLTPSGFFFMRIRRLLY